jgi:hypothetical protein
LRLIGADNRVEEERLLRVVARAGAPAPREDRPLVLAFAPAAAHPVVTGVQAHWMIEAIVGLEQNPELHRLAREMKAAGPREALNRTVLIRDGAGESLLRAAALGRELLLEVGAPATSYFAAAVLQAALGSVTGPPGNPEQDVMRIPSHTLSGWNRPPAAVGADVWMHADSSDSRWFWIAALVLMGLEEWLRRRRRTSHEVLRAAA